MKSIYGNNNSHRFFFSFFILCIFSSFQFYVDKKMGKKTSWIFICQEYSRLWRILLRQRKFAVYTKSEMFGIKFYSRYLSCMYSSTSTTRYIVGHLACTVGFFTWNLLMNECLFCLNYSKYIADYKDCNSNRKKLQIQK